MSSVDFKLHLWATFFMASLDINASNPFFPTSFSNKSLPLFIVSSLWLFLYHCLILFLAVGVTTKFNQSKLGLALLLVNISIKSPLLSLVESGDNFSLILIPLQWLPTSEWILYAKSTAVDPFLNPTTSPLGVITKTSSSNKSSLIEAK